MNKFDDKVPLDENNHHGLSWDNFYKVRINNKWGIICEITLDCYNYHEIVVVEPEFDEIEKIHPFFYIIKKANKSGLVNGGGVILKPIYDRIYVAAIGKYRYRVEADAKIGIQYKGNFSWLHPKCNPGELNEYNIISQIQDEINLPLECIEEIDNWAVPGYVINPGKNITELNLGYLDIYQFPESIMKLENLCYLNLRKNHISKIPESICELKYLQVFNMSSNNLDNIPDSIGKLYNLKELYLQFNNIYKIPASLAQLKQLIILDISNNKIKKIPGKIKKRKNLKLIK